MAVIAFLLVATAVKLLRPRTQLFRMAMLGTLGLWIIFGLVQPDAIIANVNVNGYLNGSISKVDTSYIANLPNASDHLTRLKEHASDPDVRDCANQKIKDLKKRTTNPNDWPLWGI